MDYPNLLTMDLEWRAWRSFCHYFEEVTGIHPNDEKARPVIEAVKRWGEELAELRRVDTNPRHAAAALKDARENCPLHEKTEGG